MRSFRTIRRCIIPRSTAKWLSLPTNAVAVRGRARGGLYYFAGLRIVPPPGFEPHDWLVHYTIFKLDVLALAVQRAKGALSKGNFQSMVSQVTNIKGDITKGNFVEALAHTKNLQKTNQPSIFAATVHKLVRTTTESYRRA